ncbi:hypothetical protein C6P86_19335 [Burkholderia multivorans]|nr:hypothetical protein C6P91_30650 [Burkholderia multivorans]PRE17228.1 hypothetical protein C6P78_11645 [Burkholderia multivorans]PRE62989.1 hypothetical protein C6P86_19335 [Burkholderia multivorans]PRE90557.1 hypothetical protein C6Q00_03720 [Burkholderia multivorans]PRG21745.1 hypothetical protein C6T57_16560 [Burkholderia multivorans]
MGHGFPEVEVARAAIFRGAWREWRYRGRVRAPCARRRHCEDRRESRRRARRAATRRREPLPGAAQSIADAAHDFRHGRSSICFASAVSCVTRRRSAAPPATAQPGFVRGVGAERIM